MKRYKLLIYLSFIFLLGCKDDFLERAPGLNLDESTVFGNFETAYRFHADIYTSLQKGYNVLGSFEPAPIACATDEADSRMGWHTSNSFNMGMYDGVDNQIARNYEGIRKANVFLSKVDIIPFPSPGVKNRMIGEVYFLRAFYFHELIKRYGGMPILNDKLLYPNDNLLLPRNSYKECVDAVLSDLKQAIQFLPVVMSESEQGRVTRGAAMALKSRVLLYAASPLWNNEITNPDKWLLAARAAKEVLDLTDSVGNKVFSLYNTGNKAKDYEQLFFKRPEEGNREVIFWYNASPVSFSNIEIRVWAPAGEGFGGTGAVAPTQNFVNLFEMANGKLITDPTSGYDPQNPYLNRDPRFYKIIIYNGSVWQGTTAQLYLGGKHRLTKEKCVSGYYVRKYLPEALAENSSSTSYHNWIYFRLAEIYLNYAEALNETLSSPSAEVYDAVNAIRNRSGMPVLTTNLTQDQMRERIKNERAIELCFEEHRWWDVRRWLDGVKQFNGSMYEMEITKRDDGSMVYNEVPFEERIFTGKMNLYPIPLSELQKNSLLVQNPGWSY